MREGSLWGVIKNELTRVRAAATKSKGWEWLSETERVRGINHLRDRDKEGGSRRNEKGIRANSLGYVRCKHVQ